MTEGTGTTRRIPDKKWIFLVVFAFYALHTLQVSHILVSENHDEEALGQAYDWKFNFYTHKSQNQSAINALRAKGGLAALQSVEHLLAEPILVDDRYIHFVYSIGCNALHWQLIQSITLDYSFSKVQQRGYLTRLVSGCENDETLQTLAKSSPFTTDSELRRFDVYFSTANHTLPNGKTTYVQFNRPIALLAWLEKQQKSNPNYDKTIFIILDPDFVFTVKFPEKYLSLVKPGSPVSQTYPLGSSWNSHVKRLCSELIVGKVHGLDNIDCATRAKVLSNQVSKRHYDAGVPYLIHAKDIITLMRTWIPLIGPYKKVYTGIESDMYAYAIAASILDLKHTLWDKFMSTCMKSDNPNVDPLEGTVFIHYCQRYIIPETRKPQQYLVNTNKEVLSTSKATAIQQLLNTEHSYVFTKHWTHARGRDLWMFECDGYLLVDPPVYNASTIELLMKHQPERIKHYDVIRIMVPLIQQAMTAYKQKYCDPSRPIQLSKQLILHEAHTATKQKLNHVIEI